MTRRALRCMMIPAVLLVLLAQCAPVLWRMHCLVSGRNVLSLFEPQTCGPLQESDADRSSIGTSCCVFDHAGGERVDLLKSALVHFPVLDVLQVQFVPCDPDMGRVRSAERMIARPPPLDASERVVLHRTLLL